jgi:simple sugar transport system permease protein
MLEPLLPVVSVADPTRSAPMLTALLALAMIWFMYRTRSGLVMRSVGESPESAHALGYPVRLIRLLAVACGGALCGLAGAYLSVIYTPLWVEGMVSGNGWIALALTTFATWRPARVLLGAYLFGGITILQLHAQGAGVKIPSQAMAALPYLVTIIALVIIMSRRGGQQSAPQSSE